MLPLCSSLCPLWSCRAPGCCLSQVQVLHQALLDCEASPERFVCTAQPSHFRKSLFLEVGSETTQGMLSCSQICFFSVTHPLTGSREGGKEELEAGASSCESSERCPA